tara:strand:+ start:10519 stop:12759 length:2241 start_codon:yes stop_codon:yes gene_type:complete
MSRSEISTEFNTFVGGILTEANPINFPPGYSLDEENFILERNGTRRRRPGMSLDTTAIDFDQVALDLIPSAPYQKADLADYSIWKDAYVNGLRQDLLVITYHQTAAASSSVGQSSQNEYIQIVYSLKDSTNITGNLIATGTTSGHWLASSTYKSGLIVNDYEIDVNARIESRLHVVNGSSMGVNTKRDLTIRDFNGVFSEAVDTRPVSLSDNHAYNLFNNGWTKADVDTWNTADNTYPSVSDSPVYSREKGTSFSTTIMDNALFGNSRLNGGHSIITPWFPYREYANGVQEITGIVNPNPAPPQFGTVLPDQRQTVIESSYFGGRWMGLCESGPLLSNGSAFILYSQSASQPDSYANCYQTNDPTSSYLNQVIDTDGGLIDVSSIGRPNRLVTSRSKIMAFGDTGVVEVASNASSFTPLAINVKEVSNNSIYSETVPEPFTGTDQTVRTINRTTANSIITVEDQFFYWSEVGIIALTFDSNSLQYREDNITDRSIQTLYNNIPANCKAYATGIYVPEESVLMWMYSDDSTNPDRFNKALCYDAVLKAWFKFSFFNDVDNYIRGAFLVPSNSDLTGRSDKFQRVTFLVQTPNAFTLAYFKTNGFDDVAGEEQAFLQTGYLNANDSSKFKQGTYIVPSFLRTEDGFTDDGSGNLTANKESSCIISAWWDYAEDSTDTKVNPPFEAYRLNKVYIPTGPADTFDYGQSVITTKNRLTGRGRALSLRFETSVGKDCRLLGWNLGFGAVGKV